MTKVVQWLNDILVGKMHLDPDLAGFLNTALLIVAIIFIGIGVNWI